MAARRFEHAPVFRGNVAFHPRPESPYYIVDKPTWRAMGAELLSRDPIDQGAFVEVGQRFRAYGPAMAKHLDLLRGKDQSMAPLFISDCDRAGVFAVVVLGETHVDVFYISQIQPY